MSFSSTSNNPSIELFALFEKDFQWEITDNPEFATQAGEHDFCILNEIKLQDVSPAAYELRAKHSKEQVELVKELKLKFEQSFSSFELWLIEVFENAHTELYTNLEKCKFYLMPINGIGAGCVTASFLESIEWMRFEKPEDYQLLFDRIVAFPTQVNQFEESFRRGLKENIIASNSMIHGVIEQLEHVVKGNFEEIQAPLTLGLASKLVNDDMMIQFQQGIENMRQSLIHFLQFFKTEYVPNVRQVDGCHSLTNGDYIYELCLQYHTTTKLTADEVHEIGIAEVKRIEERYRNDVLIPLGFDPDDFKGFCEYMKTNKDFYVSTSADLLNLYRRMVSKVNSILPSYFQEFPRSPLEITDKYQGPAAYYLAGTADGKRPGRFYVNCSHIEQRPTYEAVALTLHEAIPGHHHQIALMLENEKLPKFLRFQEDRRYEVCPCKRNMTTAYLEGWGLYSEYLGEEMGMYESPYDIFGRLSMEMMRAVRLVVDSGIHSKKWTIEKSIVYMMDKTGMHRHEVETEIYRYSSWPGQACAYKIGEIEIKRLRKICEDSLGSNFDLKEFHTLVLLNGPMSLNLLADMVIKYIANKKTMNNLQ